MWFFKLFKKKKEVNPLVKEYPDDWKIVWAETIEYDGNCVTYEISFSKSRVKYALDQHSGPSNYYYNNTPAFGEVLMLFAKFERGEIDNKNPPDLKLKDR